MTVADQIKNLDQKIMQNKAKYDLDRKMAKIFPLSSNNFDKYEYLTDEDLVLRQALLNKQDLKIIHWVQFSIRTKRGRQKRKTLEKTEKY